MYAVVWGHAEVARMLLEAGIDIHLTDSVSKFVYMECLLTHIIRHIFVSLSRPLVFDIVLYIKNLVHLYHNI